MLGGGCACLLHGIFPFWFARTGSDAIIALHRRMVITRNTRRVAIHLSTACPEKALFTLAVARLKPG